MSRPVGILISRRINSFGCTSSLVRTKQPPLLMSTTLPRLAASTPSQRASRLVCTRSARLLSSTTFVIVLHRAVFHGLLSSSGLRALGDQHGLAGHGAGQLVERRD